MRNNLLISAAAAALIGTAGLASAQAPGGGSGAPGAPAAQSAPSAGAGAAGERAAPMDRGASDMKAAPGAKGGQAEQRMPGDKAAPQRAQSGSHDDMKTKGAASESRDRNSRDRNAAESHDRNSGKAASDNNADRNGMKGAEKNASDSKAGTTTGQAGAGAKLSAEQRTTVRTAITKQNIKPVTNINFSISVGTHVPRTVQFHPLPVELVTIYPRWRGYEFFLVGDEIVVVNPRTLEIVAVLEA
jgi:hypothetical protein